MGIETNGKKITFEEFCFLIKDGEKADLIDWCDLHEFSGQHGCERALCLVIRSDRWLLRGTRAGPSIRVARGVPVGSASRSGAGHRLRADKAFELVQRGFVDGPPDLALEIVSPDSVERDYVRKREQYRQAGVKEYWIVDEMEQRVVLLRRNASGSYREVKPRLGVLHSKALPGFWLRPEWLWQEPRPKKKKVLAEILKE